MNISLKYQLDFDSTDNGTSTVWDMWDGVSRSAQLAAELLERWLHGCLRKDNNVCIQNPIIMINRSTTESQAYFEYVNLVDLVKSFPTSSYFLLAKFGFGTAEKEPFQGC